MSEILNIEYHRKDLILKALNRKANYKEAAAALGVSKRTLQRDIVNFNIKKIDDQYQIVKTSLKIILCQNANSISAP
jgi:DeoR/GlpR family transcriptional regulator of sugar metabolism